FGAPNGLCSSITESQHIKAVKNPWCQSSKFEVLGQMLLTNQCLDKLTASEADFIECGMLLAIRPPPLHDMDDNDDDDEGGPIDGEHVTLACTQHMSFNPTIEQQYPHDLLGLATAIDELALPLLVQHFIYNQLQSDSLNIALEDITIASPISVFHLATATFHASSDPSGIHGMCHVLGNPPLPNKISFLFYYVKLRYMTPNYATL
ncbi:hypothetical protein L208DRAFT_1274100, partial [Tricholoma matsutake]